MRPLYNIMLIWLAISATGCSRMIHDEDQKQNDILSLLLTPPTTCTVGGVAFLATDTACAANSGNGSGWLIAPSDSGTVLSLQLSFRLANDGELMLYAAGDRANLSQTGARFAFTPAGSTAYHFDSKFGADVGYAAGTDPVVYCLEIDSGQIPPQLLARGTPCPRGTASVSDATFNSVDAGLPGTSAASGTSWGLKLTNTSIQWVSLNPSRIFNP